MFRAMIAAFFSLLMAGDTIALKLMSLDVPTAVMQGDSVWLNCTLDLESDDLYSVKWYKNDVEFYRHLPQDKPSGQKYDIPGVHLDLQKSVQGHVYLKRTDLETEGVYRCEASAESPTFQTVEAEKQLKVYVLPQEDPIIEGSQSRYEVGDFVNVTCRSGASKPPSVLKWYINGKEAFPGEEKSYPAIKHENGLQTSLLGLMFMVKPQNLFQGGALTLKCTATVSQTYSTSSEELIIGEKYVDASSPLSTLAVLAEDGPIISGGKTHYRVGDDLVVNCSSTQTRPIPQLHWFLNEEPVPEEHIIRYRPTEHGSGEHTAVLGLKIRVQSSHMEEGEMRVKCTASRSRVINVRSDERTVGGNSRNSGLQVAENYGKVQERSGATTVNIYLHLTAILLFHALFLL